MIPPIPSRTRLVLCAALLAVAATGCSSWRERVGGLPSLGVYKLDINQGNYITQDMVEKLKVGQTKQQVRLVLGTPLLADPFHANRWDYVYQYARDGKPVESRKFTVYFADEKLARWEGDDMPPSAVELNRIAADRTLAPNAPADDDKGFFGKLIDILKGNK